MDKPFEVIITRDHISKEVAKNGRKECGTLGHLVVWADDAQIFSCYTMENAGAPTDKSGQDKPIIPRDYQLEWADSSVCVPPSYRQKGANGRNRALWLKAPEVPGFAARRIMIHIGNDAIDTLGCILLGLGYNKETGKITESTKAVERFYQLCETHGVENFSLTIIGLPDEEF